MSTSTATHATAARAPAFGFYGMRNVVRLGFGTMQLTGKGVWGDPPDIANARRIMLRARELGTVFFDAADSYGPETVEHLCRETLYPYDGLLIATKGGLMRPGPNQWVPNGRPDYLRACVLGSLKRLALPILPLWQLHRVDPKVPRDEQFGVIAEMRAEGLIKHVGLSQATVDDLRAADSYFKVASVQNLYNIGNRTSDDVLEYCEREHIAFIPWYPLANGSLAKPGGKLAQIATKHGATTAQVALAWLLQKSPVMLPIPGTANCAHLEENTRASALSLDADDMAVLDVVVRN
jgi:pyridoxine 4-dehydrogenase